MKAAYAKIIVLSTLTLLMSVSFSVHAQTSSIAGTWDMTVETSAGSGTPVFVLVLESDSIIRGEYTGALGEGLAVTGTIQGSEFTLRFSISGAVVVYTGTVEGDTMEGTVDLAGYGQGTFTGRRRQQ